MPQIRGTIGNWEVRSSDDYMTRCPFYLWAVVVYLNRLFKKIRRERISNMNQK